MSWYQLGFEDGQKQGEENMRPEIERLLNALRRIEEICRPQGPAVASTPDAMAWEIARDTLKPIT